MKAMVFRECGGSEKLEPAEVETPVPGHGEVLIKVMAVSLNHLDIWARKGAFGAGIPMPHIGGCDVCGIVAEAGSGVETLKPGDRVIVSPGQGCGDCSPCRSGRDSLCADFRIFGFQVQGGFCEYVVTQARHVLPVSKALDYAEWAAMPLVYVTAHHMLFERARLRPGESVLVHAAGSGVGVAAIQLARLAGARVMATSASDDKLRRAREILHADEVASYRNGSVVEAVRQWTGGRGVDVVIDSVGADLWAANLECLARGGRLVNCGVTSGGTTEMQFRPIYARQISVLGSYMGDRHELDNIVRMAEARMIRPVVDKVFHLSFLGDAQRRMENRENFGKIVVVAD